MRITALIAMFAIATVAACAKAPVDVEPAPVSIDVPAEGKYK